MSEYFVDMPRYTSPNSLPEKSRKQEVAETLAVVTLAMGALAVVAYGAKEVAPAFQPFAHEIIEDVKDGVMSAPDTTAPVEQKYPITEYQIPRFNGDDFDAMWPSTPNNPSN